jgi:hypothetical protein
MDTAPSNVAQDVGRQVLERPLDELGQCLDRLAQGLGDVLGVQDDAFGAPLAQIAAADVHLGGAAVGRRESRADLDLDALGVGFADEELMAALERWEELGSR